MILRGFRYKLRQTAEQEAAFRQFSGVCRLVYNLALEQRRDWWRQHLKNTGKSISYASQCRELTALRAEFDWIAAVSQTCQQQALRDLDKAYQNFFAGHASYPLPRKRGLNDSFRFQANRVSIRRLNRKWSAVRLPKIGEVKFRDTRPIRGKVKNVTVSLAADGWHISFACEIEHEAPANHLPDVGIDRGVANAIALSTRELLTIPASLEKLDRRIRKAQQILSRRKRGSKRRAKQLARVSKIQAKAARIRQDFNHRASLSIARRFGMAGLEDLNVKNMTASARGTVENPGTNVRQKAGLNRAILARGWFSFDTFLTYKMEERGGRVIKVNPAYTSQTCSACGAVDAENRKSQAVFECVACGYRDHADVNAAKNILRRSTASMLVEDARQRSKARTRKATA